MSAEIQSPKFNWVEARAVCSLLPVFKKLQMDVRDDAETLNRLRGGSLQIIEVAVNEKGALFSVFSGSDEKAAVEFSLHSDYIKIATRKSTFTLTLTLDNDCRCKLRVVEDSKDERVLEQWQVRRLVLEDLFFNT